ncbi:MAG: DUF885 domain-containing protein [Pseudomonadota bacterium]
MKRALKIIVWPIGLLFLALAVFVVNLIYFKPFFINHFYERVFVEFALENPELLTQTRILASTPLRFYHDDLADYSEAATDKQYEKLKDDFATLKRYDEDGLSESQLLSKRILTLFLEQQVEQEKYRFHNYPVNQLFGIQNGVPTFMANFHFIEKKDDARAYVARLSKIDTQFDQVIDGLKIREEKGITPPTFVVEKVLEEMTNFVATPAEENILYTSFVTKLKAEKLGFSEDEQADYLAEAKTMIEAEVYPAYQALIDYFSYLKPKTTSDAGVWKFPDGLAFYNAKLRENTTTNMTADEIHNLGLAEVDRIQSEIVTILAGEGFDATGGFTPMIEALAADERFYFEDSEEGRGAILQGYRDIIFEISAKIDDYFRLKYNAAVGVQRVPVFREKTAPGAYYNQPSLDGARPGIFFANLYDIKASPRYGMRTLAYHEAVPGHHLQKAVQAELTGLPTFRNILGFTAYSEGWALYAERLAWEMGLQTDPYDNVGRLQAELFRAVRLVVDTGIHAKKWTREQAIDYMRTNTGMALSDVVAEIERYIVMPGQATAYKVGMNFILGLREKAQAALGDAFDIRDFHDALLENGDLPLLILEEKIDAYIERVQAAS